MNIEGKKFTEVGGAVLIVHTLDVSKEDIKKL